MGNRRERLVFGALSSARRTAEHSQTGRLKASTLTWRGPTASMALAAAAKLSQETYVCVDQTEKQLELRVNGPRTM